MTDQELLGRLWDWRDGRLTDQELQEAFRDCSDDQLTMLAEGFQAEEARRAALS